MHIPFMSSLLHIEPVGLDIWASLIFVAILLIVVMEIEKVVRKKISNKRDV